MKRQGQEPDPDQLAAIRTEVRDDGLIDPTDTCNTLGTALFAALCSPIVRTPGGVLRI